MLYLLHAHRLRPPEFHVGGYGDGILAVAVHQLRGMPLGTNVGHLTERHIGARHHGRNQLVLDGFVVVGVVVLLGIQPHGDASTAFPNGSQGLAVEAAGQIQGEEAFGESQAGTFLGFHGHFHRQQLLIVIGVHPAQFLVKGEHIFLDLLRYGSGLAVVIAININLDRR